MKKALLNDIEAAIKLGITKELLYAYIRNAPKKHLGHNKKLLSEVINGNNYFNEEDLDEFDKYLKEPWSKPEEPRPEIPKYIQEYLKVEIGGKCPISDKGYPLDNAHIIPYTESLNHHHHNLIRIAKEEHTKADNGIIPRHILRDIKNELIKTLRNKLRVENNRYRSSFYPPSPHPIFIGRLDKLLELTKAMEYERLIIVEGLGGVGKTQLVLNALDNVVYHNPVLWIDIENIRNLNDLLIILNNAISHYIGNIELGTLVDSLRDTPITLVLDSLENLLITDKDDTEDFINALMTKNHQTQLIITSQIDLSILDQPKTVIKLEALAPKSSLLLMEALLEGSIIMPQKHIDWFINFCSGHPLSIKLIVSLMKFYKSSDQVIEKLKETGTPKHPMRNKYDKSTSLDICLSTIYNYLSNDQEKILQYIKFYPGGIKLQWVKEQLKIPTFINDIAILQLFFLIEIRKDQLDFKRLFIPNPIRPFLKEKALAKSKDSELDLQKSAITNIMMEVVFVDSHYIETGKYGTPSYGIMRIEDELPNLLEAYKIAQESVDSYDTLGDNKLKIEYLNIVLGIASSLSKFCFTRGYFNYGILFSRAGIKSSIQLGEIVNASIHYMYLGRIQTRQFDIKGLSKTVEELEKLAKDTSIIEVKANAVWAKGNLEFEKGNFSEALICYEETISLLQEIEQSQNDLKELNEHNELGRWDQSFTEGNIALVIFDIAKVYEFTGKFQEAIDKYKEALKTFILFNDQVNLPNCYHHLGYCYCEIGRFKKGIDYYLKAIKGFKDIGQFDYVANSISDLGKYVEERPEIAKLDLLDEEILINALDRINYQLKDFIQRELSINKSLDSVLNDVPYPLLSKTIEMIKLISFSPHRLVLSNSIAELVEEIGVQNMKIGYLTAILNVGHAIGSIDQWRNLPDNHSLMVKAILQGCLIINRGPDLKSQTKIFYWLAKWMQYTKLDPAATAEKMWNQACESKEY